MPIKSLVYGEEVLLRSEIIKQYKNFVLYQIYKVDNDKNIPIYKTCERRENEYRL